MNVKQITTALLFLPVMYVLSSTTALAGGESGFYIGGSVGNATVDRTENNFNFSESDSGYKIFAGYNFGIIPLLDIAIEGSYVDFGKPSGTKSNGDKVEYDLSAWDGFGLVGLTFGPFALFGKVGLVAWDSDSAIDALKDSDSGTDPAYGIGVKFQLFSFEIRAEYEYFDFSTFDDVSMASLGVAYTF